MTMRWVWVAVFALCLINPARAQVGYDSGAIVVTATPNSSSHAAGSSVGGLFVVPLARTAGGSGILTSVFWKSTGGATTQLLVRIWQWNPTSTTCTDQTAFVGSDTDDAYLITPPFSFTPAAPASTTGDSATYASSTGLTWDYKNSDSTVAGFNNTAKSQNLYVCVLTTATDTADESKTVRLTLSGPQN
jgi:hypothetical protein